MFEFCLNLSFCDSHFLWIITGVSVGGKEGEGKKDEGEDFVIRKL